MGLFKKKDSADPKMTGKKTGAGSGTSVPGKEQAELIAVISAAIAAYECDDKTMSGLVVRKLNRIAGAIPAWGAAGIADQIETRKM